MDLLKTAGFLFLGIGLGIPAIYGLYKFIEFILGDVALLVKIPTLLILIGFLFLVVSAVWDRLKEEKIEGV